MAGKTKTTTKEVKPKVTPKGNVIERTPDGSIELKIKIPWVIIEKEWEVVLAEMVANADLPGFRKGKAPRDLVEKRIDEARVREEVLKHLLPQEYVKAVKEYNLRPIMDPRIHLEGELIKGQDWEFHAVTCEAPEVDLNGYKATISKVTAKSKIVIPGKESEGPKLDEIVKVLLESAKVTIPVVLVEKEADRLISQTLDEIKRLGMNLDQYLASTGKTAEDLRGEYAQKAINDLKLELVLQKVSETEKISVDEAEIQKTIDNAKPEEKQSLAQNKYLLASIIRQQKTLDFLKSL